MLELIVNFDFLQKLDRLRPAWTQQPLAQEDNPYRWLMVRSWTLLHSGWIHAIAEKERRMPGRPLPTARTIPQENGEWLW